MFYKNYIEKIYIVNGLARSGNHLFISWLISSFNKNEVYYLNNIKINKYGLVGLDKSKELDIDAIIKYHLICCDNKYGKKFDDDIKKNLATLNQMTLFLTKKTSIKILILSIENKKTRHLDFVADIFKKYKEIYKCLVLRDCLNLFSSRIESEKKLETEEQKEGYYVTDNDTLDWWLDHYHNKNKYITFNYNNFLCYTISRKKLAEKLNIDYNKTKITLNKFGLTSGSSFKNSVTNESDYIIRWTKYKNNPVIKNLLDNADIIKILCKDFSMCLNIKSKKIKICKKIYALE